MISKRWSEQDGKVITYYIEKLNKNMKMKARPRAIQ